MTEVPHRVCDPCVNAKGIAGTWQFEGAGNTWECVVEPPLVARGQPRSEWASENIRREREVEANAEVIRKLEEHFDAPTEVMADAPVELVARTLKSDFAILDVKFERGRLKRLVESGERIPIVIRGFIDAVHSQDDGVSREFSVSVTDVMVIRSLAAVTALRELIYEITHLSVAEDDGSHRCTISKTALDNARRALSRPTGEPK
jgi:hypothetical protein